MASSSASSLIHKARGFAKKNAMGTSTNVSWKGLLKSNEHECILEGFAKKHEHECILGGFAKKHEHECNLKGFAEKHESESEDWSNL
jgi:hypothetical protein